MRNKSSFVFVFIFLFFLSLTLANIPRREPPFQYRKSHSPSLIILTFLMKSVFLTILKVLYTSICIYIPQLKQPRKELGKKIIKHLFIEKAHNLIKNPHKATVVTDLQW